MYIFVALRVSDQYHIVGIKRELGVNPKQFPLL